MANRFSGYCLTEEQKNEIEETYNNILKEYNDNGNFVYIKINKGQKKGSIAKLVSDTPPKLDIYKERRYSRNNKELYRINIFYYGNLKWDGRKDTMKKGLSENNYLEGYKGKTVFNSVSAKKVKLEALKNPVYDINDKELNIGDSIIYINTRYGKGSKLCFGTIDRFEAKYSSCDNKVDVFTIVKLKGNEQESKISNANEYIYGL